jgi:hypothetical protein
MTIANSRNPTNRKRIVKLCPAVEKMIRENPPYIGLTGDALRWMIERAVKAQRKHDERNAAVEKQ